jgi:DNA-binding winged helix-turn-helix (wHTH) protein/pimeloyl-ACP methyl ester carboxylesterase
VRLTFATCSIDPRRRELHRDGAPVHVEPQVFDLIHALAAADGAVLSKEALVERVWRGLNVSDSTIAARISAARAAVGDDGKAQRIIRTVPRRGVRLAVPVVREAGPGDRGPPGATDSGADDPGATAPGETRAGLRTLQGTGEAGRTPAPEVRYAASTDGLAIAWAQSGTGPPLLRAGHWLSHLELDWRSPVWGPILRDLGTGRRLVRYDQRGMGLSGREIGSGDLALFVADMKAVADAAGLARFPILAASQATPVALRFAAENPERVSRLVLYGGYCVGRALREDDGGDMSEDTALALIRSGWGRHGSTFVRALSALYMPDATPEQIANFVDIQLASASPENAVAIRRAVDRFDVRDVLPRVRAPVLLLHAAGDVVQPLAQARMLAAGLPDARLVVLDSPNHTALPQHPSWPEAVARIAGFLAEDDAGPRDPVA